MANMRVTISDPSPRAIVESERVADSQTPSAVGVSSPFAQVLRDLGHEIDRGEDTIRAAVRSMRAGADPGPAGLIALQMSVYRYGEAVDLVSRVVDRATSGLKTVVQGSGQ
jgi:hypothetical protein